VDERDLEDHFNQVGKVLRVSLKRDLGGNSLGYAFVDFEDQATAERGMSTLNNSDLKGKQLHIEFAKPKGGGDDRDTFRGRGGFRGGRGRGGDRDRGGGRGRGRGGRGGGGHGYQEYDLDYYGGGMGYGGYYGYDPNGYAMAGYPPPGAMMGYAPMPYGYAHVPAPSNGAAPDASSDPQQAWRGDAAAPPPGGGYDYYGYAAPVPMPPSGYPSGGGPSGYGKARRGGRGGGGRGGYRPY
jgi:hypothetical protein